MEQLPGAHAFMLKGSVQDIISQSLYSGKHKMREIQFIERNIDIFCCPKCNGDLRFDGKNFECSACYQAYQTIDSIPSFFGQMIGMPQRLM